MIFTLPSLPYCYNALEPYIDSQTMELHHTKHHQGYVNNLNQAISGKTVAQGVEPFVLENVLKTISSYGTIIRNNAGGHFNHLFFWDSLTPNFSEQPGTVLLRAIEKSFTTFEAFKKSFTATAMAHFGSGWTWLSVAKNGNLIISSTANQDNPLMDTIPILEQAIPILGLDVWEHAYYLLYQNRRLAYIEAFWEVIHWKIVEDRLNEAITLCQAA